MDRRRALINSLKEECEKIGRDFPKMELSCIGPAKMDTLKERKPNDPNPFVVGEDTVERFLTVLGECALATKAYVEAGQPGKEPEKK